MIKISSEEYISELGKRENNEDNCAFIRGATYVVCDGVGGSEKGEIASDITVRCFIDAFKVNPHADANQVIKIVETKLTDYINANPEAAAMGTTLTLSQLRDDGIYVAWCGDSRIYQFRKGEIIFKTVDHSWVNDAVKSGIITPEEAINHPKSNVITRAVQGSHKPTKADTQLLTDIEKGDLFFHCSDGVLESWNDDDLKALFSSENDPKIILEIIKRECLKQSKDNFTAIVYRVDEVVFEQITTPYAPPVVEAIPVTEKELSALSKKNTNNNLRSGNLIRFKAFKIPVIVFFMAILFLIVFWFFFNNKKNTGDNQGKHESPAKVSIQQPADNIPPKEKDNSDAPGKLESKTDIKNEAAKPAEKFDKTVKENGKPK
jgi:PPM family protein phosphatase